jgi:Tol biopolymer transport system component
MGGEVGTPSLSGTPSWSPNGKRLAFYSNEPFVPRQPESAVKIYNLATGSVTLASVAQDGTLVGGSANIPLTAVWSPNGNKLIFRGDSPYHIYEKDLTTGTLTLLDAARDGLAPIPTIYGFAVTWVGGAARVAFEDSTQSVYVLDEAGDTLMAVDGYARQPSWSADGERLAVYGYENSHAEWKVWDFTTKDMEDVRDPSFPENDAGFAQWSPTGSRLAFSTFAPLLGAGNYNGGLEVYARDFR